MYDYFGCFLLENPAIEQPKKSPQMGARGWSNSRSITDMDFFTEPFKNSQA